MLKWLMELFNKRIQRYPGPNKKICNLQKDDPDTRDFVAVESYVDTSEVPSMCVISEDVMEVKSQGSLGSCGSHAIANAFEIINRLKERELSTSELFHYYITREYENHLLEDCGMQIRNGIKMAQQKGLALERFHPYNVSNWLVEPSFASYVSARCLRIKSYARIYSVSDIKVALSLYNKPVVIGLKVYSKFMNNRTGIIPMPTETEAYQGGHAVTIVGYDNDLSGGRFKILNSWGTNWGAKGYAWISYDYVAKYMLDAWTMEVY